MEKNLISSVLVKGQTWFDKTGGNTYYNTEIWINGRYLGQTGFTAGYEFAWEQGAAELFNEIFGTEYTYLHKLEPLGVHVYRVCTESPTRQAIRHGREIMADYAEKLAVPNHG